MKKIILALFLLLFISSCGDPVPTDYEEEIIIQAYLYVDQPIRDIVVMRSMPVLDSFNLDKALIKNASVVIRGDGREMSLIYNSDGDTLLNQAGYDYNDDYLVKPQTQYKLEVTLEDGRQFFGTTTTPARFSWRDAPDDFIKYPDDINNKDTIKTISWEPVPNTFYYIISVKALDTIDYGIYVDTIANDEKNEHVFYPWAEDEYYERIVQMEPIPANKTPIVWTIFRWYGLHETAVYAPDPNYYLWFLQYISSSENIEFLSSIENGIGVFGSASVIRDTSFIIKNQP